jgi:DNA-binding MarR family transcriptional regulator
MTTVMRNIGDLEERSAYPDDGFQPRVEAYVALRQTADVVDDFVEAELAQFGLTLPLYGILLNLSTRGPLSLSDLSDSIFRSNSTITALVDRLEADGLVVRSPSEVDRRVITAHLTEKGWEFFHEARPRHREFLSCMMSLLDEEELKQLTSILGKVKGRVEAGCP